MRMAVVESSLQDGLSVISGLNQEAPSPRPEEPTSCNVRGT